MTEQVRQGYRRDEKEEDQGKYGTRQFKLTNKEITWSEIKKLAQNKK